MWRRDRYIAQSRLRTKTTIIDDNSHLCIKMPWKPGFSHKLPNNVRKVKHQMMRENQLFKTNRLHVYNDEINNLLSRSSSRTDI